MPHRKEFALTDDFTDKWKEPVVRRSSKFLEVAKENTLNFLVPGRAATYRYSNSKELNLRIN